MGWLLAPCQTPHARCNGEHCRQQFPTCRRFGLTEPLAVFFIVALRRRARLRETVRSAEVWPPAVLFWDILSGCVRSAAGDFLSGAPLAPNRVAPSVASAHTFAP